MANAMNKVRSDMAQRFVDALSQGQLPWRACWRQQRPINMTTGKLYRGVNALYLSYIAEEMGYADPRWCTYKQAQEKGWQVRKGEKSARVEYWAYYDHKQKKILSWEEAKKCLSNDPNYMENLQLSCRVYSVFNASQIDGVPELLRGTTDIGAVRAQRDTLILNMNVGYREQGDRAYYSSYDDQVTLPPEADFDDTYSYMATFLHECGHASGHPSRLCRDMSGWHGTPEYAREELRAEIASAFTMQALGLELSDAQMEQHMQQHIAYVQSWAGVLKKNPEELFRAIKEAEEISDYLMEKGEFTMNVNKHGRKILNLKAISGATVDNPNGYSQISYDITTGELMENWHAGNSDSSWTEYHDPNVITVCKTRRHMTMQELADAVHAALQEMEQMEQTRQKSEPQEWHLVYKSPDTLDGEPEIVPANELQDREVIETFRCTSKQEALEKLERYEELQRLFWDESNDPETQMWRDDLTSDEAAMVERWDARAAKGFSRLAQELSAANTTPSSPLTKPVAIESTNDYSDRDFHKETVNLDIQNENGTWGQVVDRYRVVTISGDNRLVPMTRPLDSEEAALAAVQNNPMLQLIPYDELVHRVAALPKANYTLSNHPDGHGMMLRIHGEGAVPDFYDIAKRPFQSHADQIREVIVADGITEIGRNVLCDLPALERISWAATVRGYDPTALRNCPELKEILFHGDPLRRMNVRGITSPAELLAVAPRYPQLTKEQLSEVICGMKDRLTEEQISVFAKPEFTPLQMNAIRYALKDSLPPEAIRLIADPAFDSVQMDIIRSGFTAGMTMDQVRTFAKHGLTSQQMMDTYLEFYDTQRSSADTSHNLVSEEITASDGWDYEP